jgi:hypothetical protein
MIERWCYAMRPDEFFNREIFLSLQDRFLGFNPIFYDEHLVEISISVARRV